MNDVLRSAVEQLAGVSAQINSKLDTLSAELAQTGQRLTAVEQLQPTDRTEIERMIAAEITKSRNVRVVQQDLLGDDDDTPRVRVADVVRRPARDDAARELQDLSDARMIARAIGRATPRLDALFARTVQRAALDTATAGEGYEWVAPGWSAELIRRVELSLQVAGLFRRRTMTSGSLTISGQSTRPSVYLASQNTASSGQTTAEKTIYGTRNVTFTAVKLMGEILLSRELDEDSIVPAVAEARTDLATQFARATDDAIINGDTAGAQDTGLHAKDHRKAFNGLRKKVISAGTNPPFVSLATFIADNLNAIQAAMGVYGVNPMQGSWIMGARGYMRCRLLRDANNELLVTTLDKIGAAATILTGQLGVVFGSPIIVSEFVREDLNASGVYDATTMTKTVTIYVYRDGFNLGVRREVEAPRLLTEKYAEEDQYALLSSWRGDFQPMYDATTQPIVGVGYNQALA